MSVTKQDLKQLYKLHKEVEVFKRLLAKREDPNIRTMLDKHLYEITELEKAAIETINSISDSYLRTIITLRCIEGRSWKSVATIMGGRNTPDSYRQMFKRSKI